MKTFVCSDCHFSHANIILHSKRPFTKDGDVVLEAGTLKPRWVSEYISETRKREMDEFLIRNWNSVVSDGDEVFHIGDFTFGDESVAANILRRLKGKIYLLFGNHDKPIKNLHSHIHLYPELRDKVVFLGDYAEIRRHGKTFILFHYPILVWDKMHYGAYNLSGHSHGNCPQSNPQTTTTRLIDVGIDCHDYKPWEILEIVEHLKGNEFQAFDHHKK